MDQTKTGEFITLLRKQQGLTQKQLAEQLHVSVTAVCKWEKGVNAPDISNLEALADIFQISVSELINGEKYTSPAVDISSIDTSSTDGTSQSEDVTASPKKGNLKYLVPLTIVLFGMIVAVCIGVHYYNCRPLQYKIIDSYYSEPDAEHQEAYGVEKAFCAIVEYEGDIREQLTFEFEMKIANEILLEQDINADILYIEYYDNYTDNENYDIISFIFLPLPEIDIDSY